MNIHNVYVVKNVIQMQLDAILMQSRCSFDAIKIQSRFNLDAVYMQLSVNLVYAMQKKMRRHSDAPEMQLG